MTREDRELLAELARINTAMAPLAMRIMDGTASAAEQAHYAGRLITAGQRLQHRADEAAEPIIDAEIVIPGSFAFAHTSESSQEQ